jgi:hypothetical protein
LLEKKICIILLWNDSQQYTKIHCQAQKTIVDKIPTFRTIARRDTDARRAPLVNKGDEH